MNTIYATQKGSKAGSTPVVGTIITGENSVSDKSAQSLHKFSPQNPSSSCAMKFPIKVTYRNLEAKVYRSKIDGVIYYKAAYRAKGGRVTKSFKKLKKAKEAAKEGLKEAQKRGDGLASLTTRESTKILTALDLLQDAGHSDPVTVATEYIEAKSLLSGGSIIDASRDFLRRRKAITPMPFGKATEAWLGRQESRVAPKTFEVTLKIAERLQGTFRVDCCDLGRAEINLFFDSLKTKSPKWRNHHRYVLRGVIKHAVRNHWIPKDHDLDDLLEDERAIGKKPEIITSAQFAALLRSASPETLPMIAIGGLAGARTEEIIRLCWENVWRVKEFIELGRNITKGKKRRLTPLLPALKEWLQPYRRMTGPIWKGTKGQWDYALTKLREKNDIKGHNLLRHSYASYRLAEVQDAGKVSLEMGNSPNVLLRDYRELVTPTQGKQWFSVMPDQVGKRVVNLER